MSISRGHSPSLPEDYRTSLRGELRHVIVRVVGPFAMIFVLGCSSRTPLPSAKQIACDVPLEIHSTEALLSSTPGDAEGILTFRGIFYRISISNWSFGSLSYRATGTVCNMGMPEQVAGRYRVNANGDVWRNANGVEFHVLPPLPAPANSGELEVTLSGALLPRQL